jgi:cell division transport system permease protein
MAKKRNKARKHYSLQVFTLCISTAMVLILLGLVVLTVFTGKNLSSYVKENLTLTMILSPDMTNDQASALCKKVNGMSYINGLQYISKEDALKEGTKELGADPSEFAGENPFTAEIEVRLKANYANNDSIKWISQDLKKLYGVTEVDYRQDLIDSVNKTLTKVGFVLLVIAALLTIVSFSLINNTVRLSIYSRRFTIHTMKLVGASWWFIRAPFIKRAVSLGLLSALIAILVLGGGMYALYHYEPEMTVVINWEVIAVTAATVVAFGVIITTFCSWVSVSKFLKMKAGDLYKI